MLEELYAPNLTKVGIYFLYYNQALRTIDFPRLTNVGNFFLFCNKSFKVYLYILKKGMIDKKKRKKR